MGQTEMSVSDAFLCHTPRVSCFKRKRQHRKLALPFSTILQMANDPPITERTPLLQEQSESSRGSPAPIKNRVGRRKATAVYAATLGFIAILVLLVHAIRSSLPSALSEAAAADDFAGLHAFEEYLSKLTEPHPVNSREIINMQNWLVSVVEGFQAEAAERNVQIDVVANDSSSRVVAKANWFSESKQE